MSTNDMKLEAYMASVAASFTSGGSEVRQALALLARMGKAKGSPVAIQLLALRCYLHLDGRKCKRSGPGHPKRPSGTEPRAQWRPSTTRRRRCAASLPHQSPGYNLDVSPPRSLERQITLWSKNNTVRDTGATLLEKMQEELANLEDLKANPEPLAQTIAAKDLPAWAAQGSASCSLTLAWFTFLSPAMGTLFISF
jgi:hypothetical protein